ncbi:MAG: hypothetical protein MUF15_09155 [Acidobacteria bacterium]|jgi:hypothetical protein|nr:hypothetical protein [Acidobacteriota bacterium]
MKRLILILAMMLLIFVMGRTNVEAVNWQKYTAASFSFQYPAGWEVKEQDSNIEITNLKTKEQLLIDGVPFDKNKSALQLGKQMVALFKQGLPDMNASEFKENGSESVYFAAAYSEEGIAYRAEVLVLKDNKSQGAYWFSYCAPKTGYNREFGLELLQKFVSSIAAGNTSETPVSPAAAPAGSVSLEKNARSFLFVLEFALGAPLNHSQEKIILDKLLSGWKSESPDSLKKFDAYPKLVSLILVSGQHDLEKLRLELEKSTREWLEQSDQNDPVVAIVRTQLQQRSKILAPGTPPLTEMAATAYSEMTAFAEILVDNTKALPADISPARTASIRNLLQKSWGKFSTAERNDILTTPGLWLTFRTLLQFGSAAEKEKIHVQLLKLVPGPGQTVPTQSSGAGNSKRPMGMVEHNVLMNMNQMTFNSYLWSRGFKSTMLGY